VWFHFQECTCCSESFLRSSHPLVADLLLDQISLDYTETLQAAAGKQAEEALQNTMKKYQASTDAGRGAVPLADGGIYCCIGGRTALDIVTKRPPGRRPSCAGQLRLQRLHPGANPNPTGATPIHKVISGRPIVNVPGCPPIGEVMAVRSSTSWPSITPAVGPTRPAQGILLAPGHDSCYRRPNYDAGLFVEAWDDENAKRGYCLYKMGCRGPVTYNDCGITRWNNGVSFPIQSGHGCIGCSEARFWDNGRSIAICRRSPASALNHRRQVGLAIGAATAAESRPMPS